MYYITLTHTHAMLKSSPYQQPEYTQPVKMDYPIAFFVSYSLLLRINQ